MHVANQLLESIESKQESAETIGELSNIVTSEQAQLAQHLQSALVELQILVLDHTLDVAVGDQILQRIAEVATQLHKNLAAVVAATHDREQLADFVHFANEQEIHKKLITADMSTTMLAHDQKSTALDETVKVGNELARKEQDAESTVELVISRAAESEKAIIPEAESQISENANETAVVVFEQITSMDSADNVPLVEMNQTVDETISDECVTVSNIERMSLDSEVLVPKETFHATEQKVGLTERKDGAVDNGKVKDVDHLRNDDISEENVNHGALNDEAARNIISEDEAKGGSTKPDNAVTTGNFVFHKLHRLT